MKAKKFLKYCFGEAIHELNLKSCDVIKFGDSPHMQWLQKLIKVCNHTLQFSF
jgi:hypothetical protein